MTQTPADQPRSRPSVLHLALGAATLLVAANLAYSVFGASTPPPPAPVVVMPAPPAPPPPVAEPEPEPPVLPTPRVDLSRGPDGQPIFD